MSPGKLIVMRLRMANRRTFRQDIRRKFIFFALVPMIIIGIAGAMLIYQAEETLLTSEHARLLRTVEKLTGDYYRQVHLFFNVVRNKIIQGNIAAVQDEFDFTPFLYALIQMDAHGKMEQIYSRQSLPKTMKLDPNFRPLLKPLIEGKQHKRGAVFFCKEAHKILLVHAFRHQGKIYLIAADSEPFFGQFKYFLQKDRHRSISIINNKGIYVYDSRDANLSQNEHSFFKEGAYAIAVEHSEPYHVQEYPAHYQRGDSFWKGLWDEDHFLSYARISDFDWIVVVRDSADTLDSYLLKVLAVGVVLILFTLFLTTLSARMMSNHIIIPVERLIQNINAFAKGEERGDQGDSKVSYPIFANLLESFETMRRKIIAREEKLRGQINSNRKMQEQLIQQEKLAAMGEMIGNIAHQWRQPLSVISTLATGLQTEQEIGILTDENLQESCTQINDNAQYLSGTIDDFRQFIKGDHEKQRFKAQELVDTLQNLLKGQLKSHQISLKTTVEENLEIYGYRNDLLQILINLVGNAKDALIEMQEEDRSVIIDIGTSDTEEIIIRVRDNGGGIDEGIIQRIFEPYFTTKHKSQGTGLGLHMVHRLVVEGMGGTIEVETIACTKVGAQTQGAAFTIVLPKSDETSS